MLHTSPSTVRAVKPPGSIHFGSGSRVSSYVGNDTIGMQAAEILLECGAYMVDTTLGVAEYYTWKSGVRAPCYCNCRAALSDAAARMALVNLLVDTVNEQFPETEIIVGLATAGIPWAASMSDAMRLPMAYLRNEPKAHGVGRFVQGVVPKRAKVLVVDDLVASGGSLKTGIDNLRGEVDAEVVGVLSIINWGFQSMRENLKGINIKALTSYPQIVAASLICGKISEGEFNRLLEFYIDPKKGY